MSDPFFTPTSTQTLRVREVFDALQSLDRTNNPDLASLTSQYLTLHPRFLDLLPVEQALVYSWLASVQLNDEIDDRGTAASEAASRLIKDCLSAQGEYMRDDIRQDLQAMSARFTFMAYVAKSAWKIQGKGKEPPAIKEEWDEDFFLKAIVDVGDLAKSVSEE